jgi:hypothetical protein
MEMAMNHMPVTVWSLDAIRAGATRCGHGNSNRALVNFIRHKLTTYDAAMTATRKHRNWRELQEDLQEQTLLAIAQAYAHVPAIATEARDQLAHKLPTDNIRAWRAP